MATASQATDVQAELLALLKLLKDSGYRFVTPTPATHARVIARPDRTVARSVEDVLGWSLPFAPGMLPAALHDRLRAADMLERVEGMQRSRIRVSTLRDDLYLHSAYPTVEADVVFFGPDSYRFADLVAHELTADPPHPGAHIVDIGTGAGVGAIVAARLCPAARVTMTDVNPRALAFAEINARAAGVDIATVETAGLDVIDGPVDLAIVNPPYLVDDGARLYRDGGVLHGGQMSLDLAECVLGRLAPGGRLILYTGSAIVRGEDRLGAQLHDLAAAHEARLDYRQLDPDVFGEELDRPAYRDVDRIALVAAVFER